VRYNVIKHDEIEGYLVPQYSELTKELNVLTKSNEEYRLIQSFPGITTNNIRKQH